jgi:hypothetical protein
MVVPCVLLLSAISLSTGQMLLQTIMQQRILHNYLQSIIIAQQLDADVRLLALGKSMQHSILQGLGNTYIPDDPTPSCTAGTWIYRYTVLHRTHPSYATLVILRQRSVSGVLGSLHIVAVHSE